jgi:hypothetical protein
MPDFDELANEAKSFADDHDKQSDEVFDDAAKFADEKTGNKYDSEITSGEDKAESYLGVQDQDQNGQQNQQNQGSN